MTLTAILPVSGGAKGRLTVLYRVDQAPSSISARRGRSTFSYGSLAPVKYAWPWRTKKPSPLDGVVDDGRHDEGSNSSPRYLPAGLLTSSMRTREGSSTNAMRRSLTSRGSAVTFTPFCFSSAIFPSMSAARQPR